MDPKKVSVPIARTKEIYPQWPWSHSHTLRMARAGQFKCIKVGRRYFVDLTCIEAFLDEHRMAG